MLEFLLEYKYVLVALVWGSLTLFIASIAIIPWLVTKIPADYFHKERRTSIYPGGRPLSIQLLAVAKNICGGLLVILGLAMLVLPGQGVLTILIGLFLMNFPGKYKLECRLVAAPKVLNSLNWIRTKARKPPLIIGP